jgi:hypothetical protein
LFDCASCYPDHLPENSLRDKDVSI